MKPSIQTSILMALFSCAALAQTKADPYKPTNASNAESGTPDVTVASNERSPKNLSTCLEVFSMPMAMAAAMLSDNITDEECYKRLTGQLTDGRVKQEVLMVLRSRNGEKASNESIVEEIYPTEYTPPKAPTQLTLGAVSGGKEDKPIESIKEFYTPATPTAFETRNTGETLEIEVVLSEDNRICDVRMVPEQVLLTGHSKSGDVANPCEMPTFETRRLNSSFSVAVGKPFLIGTMNRPHNSKIDPTAANTVSFAFITIKLSR